MGVMLQGSAEGELALGQRVQETCIKQERVPQCHTYGEWA